MAVPLAVPLASDRSGPRSRSALALLLVGSFLALAAAPAAGQGPPPGYYDSVDPSDADALRQTLHAVIDDHTKLPYTSASTDTWDVLELADEDPSDPGRILDVYRNASYAKQGGGNPFYQREHTWPKSYGFPDDGPTNYPYSDCHLLFLCDDGYNAARSNKPFRWCSSSCDEYPTLVNDGAGGGSGTYPGQSNWTDGDFTDGTWEAWIGRRGDVARAILYADVRYEGGFHGSTGASEPDLVATDDQVLIEASQTGSNESLAYMGMLTVLLAWHEEDPPDAKELHRNDVVYTYQGNRNPFVDHPEWVAILWGEPSPGPVAGTPWINELHYDNSGADVGEFVEVAGPAGTSLSGWSLVGYNGNGGVVYDTKSLSGTLPDQDGCVGALSFPFVGLQNGAPDGVALVDPLGTVVEFLSYEGSFVAVDGPAAGASSVDVGVEESSGTPAGHSLQRVGTGASADAFAWQPPAPDSPGQPNAGQSFPSLCAELLPYGCGVNPPGSLVVVSGAPVVGTTLTLGVENPFGTQAPGSLPFLALATAPDAAYPCGLLVPGFGMVASGALGEVLVSLVPPDPYSVLAGPPWAGTGSPAPIPLAIPDQASAIGVSVYVQGILVDPSPGASVVFGVTTAAELVLGL